MLLIADAAVVVAMAGGFAWRRVGSAAAVALVALTVGLAAPQPAKADPAKDAFDQSAALATRLAYVLTGNSGIDDTARA
ncbi:hypothetical protein J8J27_34750, partial [Mycobacterium tuberculosis]|nr:hypothetical protein [Mycobacterium tuberculosis]